MTKLKPTHPGEVLQEEFLLPLDISQYRLAKDINVPAIRINQIVHGKRAISADTALRLGKYFSTSPEFWLNLQTHYDLEFESDKLEKELKIEVKILQISKLNPKYIS
ncbi:MAG: HigA family addiction module antitoxin [Candidatus Peregrinibacteria bacterium]|nr:HigA family addiction module antitoxin [Candidatus Peregrinibacteria bacterium]MDZ4244789.1 HigA family addiction module antitoxin [Candidatus Gracilibacteria bacterium]